MTYLITGAAGFVGFHLCKRLITEGEKVPLFNHGKMQRDFTYIDDLINGISLCCNNKNAINQTFNLTYGKSKKINELVEILKTEFPKVKISYKKERNLCQKEEL